MKYFPLHAERWEFFRRFLHDPEARRRDDLQNFDLLKALEYLATGNLPSADTMLCRVPVQGSLKLNPVKYRFNEDPRVLGFQIIDLTGRTLAIGVRARIRALENEADTAISLLKDAEQHILDLRAQIAEMQRQKRGGETAW